MKFINSKDLPEKNGIYWIKYRIRRHYSMEEVDYFFKKKDDGEAWAGEMLAYTIDQHIDLIRISGIGHSIEFLLKQDEGKRYTVERRNFEDDLDHKMYELVAYSKIEEP